MSTTTATVLKEIHRLRRHLRDLQSEIDLGPRVLKIQQQKLADEERIHKEAHDTVKRLKIEHKEDEVTLRQTEQLIEKYQAQLNTAGSKKEFDAKQIEIANATTKKGELEDKILNTITEIEERTAKLPEDDRRWADAQKEFAQYQVDAKERLERLYADQKASQEDLVKWEVQLPVEIKPQYDRLVKAYGPDGLASVVGRSCQQCRRAITEQQRTNLMGGMFVSCSQCGRGLYMAEGSV